MRSGTVARLCVVIAALGCAACSAEPPVIAQRAPAKPQIAAAKTGGEVMVVVPTAGRTLLPYPETDAYRECAPFARAVSGINIYGDAWSWWGKAAGSYHRGRTPEVGAVMVLQSSRRTPLGHVSVVAEVQDSRHILVTHANWGYNGETRGVIHERQPVEDMSAANDWSVVKMWNIQAEFGSTYPTYGFIYNRPAEAGEIVITPAVAREERTPSRHSLVQRVSYAPEPPTGRQGKALKGKPLAGSHAAAGAGKAVREVSHGGSGHGGPAPTTKTASKAPAPKGKHRAV